MTMNSSGPIDLCGNIPGQSIAYELGRPNTATTLDDADVRALAGIPSGPISFTDFYGKSAGGGGGSGPGPMPGAPWSVFVTATGSSGVATTAARAALNFYADGTATATRASNSIAGPPQTTACKSWLTSAPRPGAGASYWMRLTITDATVSGPSNTRIDIDVSTASGTNSDGRNYPSSWQFSMTPGVWAQMSSGIAFATWVNIPATSLTKGADIQISGEIEFAASPGGTVIYSDTISLYSGTYGAP